MLYQEASNADGSDGRRELIDLEVQQLWGNTERVSKSDRSIAKR